MMSNKKNTSTVAVEKKALLDKGFTQVEIIDELAPLAKVLGDSMEEVITTSPENSKFAIHFVPNPDKITNAQMMRVLKESETGKRILKDHADAFAWYTARGTRFDFKNTVRAEIVRVLSALQKVKVARKSMSADKQAAFDAKLAELLASLDD